MMSNLFSDIVKGGKEGGTYTSRKRVLKKDPKTGRMSWGWGDYKYTEKKKKKKQSTASDGEKSTKKKTKTVSEGASVDEGKTSLELVREAMKAAGLHEHVIRAKVKHEGQTLADVAAEAKEARKKIEDEKADRRAKREEAQKKKREERAKESVVDAVEEDTAVEALKDQEEVVETVDTTVDPVEMAQRGLVRLVRKNKDGIEVAKWVTGQTYQFHKENKTEFWDTTDAPVSEAGSKARREAGEKLRKEQTEEESKVLAAEEFDMGNLVELEAFKVSENRPPNFLGLIAQAGVEGDPLSLEQYRKGPFTNYRIDATALRNTTLPSGEYNIKDLTPLQLLLHTGMLNRPPEGPLNNFQEEFFFTLVGRKQRYSQLSPAMKNIYAPIARNLAGWWTNLTDTERQAFWDTFVDEDWQTTVGKVADKRHENADMPLPEGMNKFKEKGYNFHEYQRKAVNFGDTAGRAIWAMEMGLGKTLAAIGLFHQLRQRGEADRMFVTAPLSAHGSWEEHFRDFSDLGDDADKKTGRLKKGKTIILTGASKKQRLAAYEAWDKGETKALVVSPDTVAKRWVETPGGLALNPEKDQHDIPGRWEEEEGKKRPKSPEAQTVEAERKQALKDYPDGTSIRITDSSGKPRRYFKKQGGQWYAGDAFKYKENSYRTVTIQETEATYALIEGHETDTEQGVMDEMENQVLAYLRDYKNSRNTRGLKEPSMEVIPPDSDYQIIKNMMEKHGETTLRNADELHKFKDPKSARGSGFVDAICRPPGRVVGMTGTPKPNGAEDFYHIVNAIAPGTLGDTVNDFADRYCYTDGKDKKILGFRPEELGTMYRDSGSAFFARTTADPDVEINLPERVDLSPRIPMDDVQEQISTRLVEWMKIRNKIAKLNAMARGSGERAEAAGMEAEALQDMLDKARSDDNEDAIDRTAARAAPWDHQVAMMRWQQLAVDPSLLDTQEGYSRRFSDDYPGYLSPKLDNVTDACMTHLTQNPDKGAVIFCEYNGGVRGAKQALIQKGLKESDIGVYTGATSATKRRQLQADLNEGRIKVLVGNTAALETGANLQKRANWVGMLNTPWDPARLTQSIARVMRQGQTSKVIVYRPTGSHVEEQIERTVSRKILQAAQATGRTMEADDAIAGSMRKPGKTGTSAAIIAEILGVDPSVFMKADEKPLTLEEMEEKQREDADRARERAAKKAAKENAEGEK